MTTGMVDIARQTVEFLYEENGGIPRDLYLPTIEDIKDEANKFTIDKVRKGAFPYASKLSSNLHLNSLNVTHATKLFHHGIRLTSMIICFNTGLTVVIRCPDSNNTNSTTGGTALPKFAIRGMLKTFGLHGVVLDVDSVSTIPNAAMFCVISRNS